MATKKKSPMKMREAKSDAPKKADKNNGQPMSAMENYAQQRNAQMKAAKVVPITRADIHEHYGPESDVHTLSRAAEIHMNKPRHRDAKMAAKKRMAALSKVAES